MTTRLLLALSLLVAASASADRLILTPTGSIAAPAQIKLEGAIRPREERPVYAWASLGIGQFELEAAYTDEGRGDTGMGFGVEAQLLPETLLTPAVGVGIRDATDQTSLRRAEYLAITKSIPAAGIPWLRDVKLHFGFGMEGIDGFFGGAQVGFPPGLELALEHDSNHFNTALAWSAARNLQLKLYGLDGDTFLGAVLRFPR